MTAKIEVIAVNIDFHRLLFAAILPRRFLRSAIVYSLLNEPSFLESAIRMQAPWETPLQKVDLF